MTKKVSIFTVASTLALALSLGVESADAQGRGRGQDRAAAAQGRDDVFQRNTAPRGNGSGKVPPGWCRGVGNPHNTPENCGYNSRDPRYPVDDRYPIDERDRSYEQTHADFHREMDAHYTRLAAQRPLDLQYQLELQVQKRAEHDNWHRRVGIAH
jgi:hypothetical protein